MGCFRNIHCKCTYGQSLSTRNRKKHRSCILINVLSLGAFCTSLTCSLPAYVMALTWLESQTLQPKQGLWSLVQVWQHSQVILPQKQGSMGTASLQPPDKAARVWERKNSAFQSPSDLFFHPDGSRSEDLCLKIWEKVGCICVWMNSKQTPSPCTSPPDGNECLQ